MFMHINLYDLSLSSLFSSSSTSSLLHLFLPISSKGKKNSFHSFHTQKIIQQQQQKKNRKMYRNKKQQPSSLLHNTHLHLQEEEWAEQEDNVTFVNFSPQVRESPHFFFCSFFNLLDEVVYSLLQLFFSSFFSVQFSSCLVLLLFFFSTFFILSRSLFLSLSSRVIKTQVTFFSL